MKVTNRHGRLRLRLDAEEAELLSSMLDELDVVIEGGPGDDEVHARLFPAAYADDDDAEREYRELTEATLRDARTERIEACRADLAAGPDIDLSNADDGRRWIQVLNDLRLALGTRLGVTEDTDTDLDPTDPQSMPWLVYHWLTVVQDSVVHGLMGQSAG